MVLVFSFYLFSFILFSSFFLVGCKYDSINGPDIINSPALPDTLGNVSGYISSSNGPVKDAYITLNNKIAFSDSNGFFEFKDCIKKNLVITILHPEFSEYSNSLDVTDSLNLNIALTRIKYDYFPLKVGNKWQYHYIYSGYTPAGGFYDAAKIYWEVISKTGNYPNWIFNLKETYHDSSDNSITTNYFNIKTEQSDSISFIGVNNFFANKIRRYYGIKHGEIVSSLEPLHEFKRNVGFIGFSYGWGGIQMGYNWWCKIIDYSLQ